LFNGSIGVGERHKCVKGEVDEVVFFQLSVIHGSHGSLHRQRPPRDATLAVLSSSELTEKALPLWYQAGETKKKRSEREEKKDAALLKNPPEGKKIFNKNLKNY
jgi:hypothetical protein